MKIKSSEAPTIFFEFIWIIPPIIMNITTVITKIIGIYDYCEWVNTGIILFMMIILYKGIVGKIRKVHYIRILGVVIFYFVSAAVYPLTYSLIGAYWPEFIFTILGYYFIGVIISKADFESKKLIRVSYITIIFLYLLVIALFTRHNRLPEMMTKSYAIMPSLMYITYRYFIEGEKKWNLIFILSGGAFLIFCSTRGPILLYSIFIFVLAVMYRNFKIYTLIASCFMVISIKSARNFLLYKIYYLVKNLGFETKIFDLFFDGRITYTSGRDKLSDAVIQLANKNPIIGNGIYSDRVATTSVSFVQEANSTSTYAHNIVLEFFCQYGYIVGILLVVSLIYIFLKALKSAHKKQKIFVLIFIFCYFGKLFVTGSYLEEREFFMLIGLCAGIIEEKRRNKVQCEELWKIKKLL